MITPTHNTASRSFFCYKFGVFVGVFVVLDTLM